MARKSPDRSARSHGRKSNRRLLGRRSSATAGTRQLEGLKDLSSRLPEKSVANRNSKEISREDRIAAIRQAIDNGTYMVSAEMIADRILAVAV